MRARCLCCHAPRYSRVNAHAMRHACHAVMRQCIIALMMQPDVLNLILEIELGLVIYGCESCVRYIMLNVNINNAKHLALNTIC